MRAPRALAALMAAACAGTAERVGESTPADTGTGGADSGVDSGHSDTASPGTDTETGDSAGPPVDADGDGHTSDDDCDDTNATVYPGAEEQPCNGRDDDCDGSDFTCGIPSGVTELGASVGLNESVFTGGLDVDVTGDGSSDLLVYVGGWEYTEWPFTESWSIAEYVVPGERLPRGGQAWVEDRAVARFAPAGFTSFGLGGAGDLDADGFADVFTGAVPEGGTYGCFSGADIVALGSGAFDAFAFKLGCAAGGCGGYPDPAGDLDGDGHGDLRWVGDVAAPQDSLLFLSGAEVVAGLADMGSPTWSLRDPSGTPYEDFVVVDAGDVDGDGARDTMAQAEDFEATCTGCDDGGTAWIVSGATLAAVGSVHLPDADWAVSSGSRFTRPVLRVVGTVGDIDADGRDDVAVRGKAVQAQEEVLLLGAVDLATSVTLADDWVQVGDTTEYLDEYPVHGDFDGDGRGDLAVLLSDDTHLCVFTGPLMASGGTLAAGNADRRYDFGYAQHHPLPPADDLDGDGQDDMLMLGNDDSRFVEVFWGSLMF